MKLLPSLNGIDRFLPEIEKFRNQRIALVTNDAALTAENTKSRVAMVKTGYRLLRLFSPEHGINIKGADGAFQNDGNDPDTQLPVISLYGEKLAPVEKELADIDMVVFDIPDVGVRFYTYLWTMTHVMEACAAFQKPLWILDRPNPLSGNLALAEGPGLDEKNCSSFIGRWDIPIRHSCTLGELALYFKATRIPLLQLNIIPIRGWNRNSLITETGFSFTPTSPAITDIITAQLYPGTGLLEGISVNEGRGTDTAFRVFGAPWINKDELADRFVQLQLPGLSFTSCSYLPLSGIYAGENCQGLQFEITNPFLFRPVQSILQLIRLLIHLYPDYCVEKKYPTRANPGGSAHLDKLTGMQHAFEKIRNGKWESAGTYIEDWEKKTRPYLLY